MKSYPIKLIVLIILIITGCQRNDKKPIAEMHSAFIGKWNSNNGVSIIINADGSGSIKKIDSMSTKGEFGKLKTSWNGKLNRSISGGAVNINENTLKISLLPIETSFRIDQFPYKEKGTLKMKLDGDVFLKQQSSEK